MTVATQLHRDITRALMRLNVDRRFGYTRSIAKSTDELNELVERVACRPLALIDPELDARLRVWRQGRR